MSSANCDRLLIMYLRLLSAALLIWAPLALLNGQNRTFEWDGARLVLSPPGEIVSFESAGLESWAAVEPGGAPQRLGELLAAVQPDVRAKISRRWQLAGFKTNFDKTKPKPSTFTYRAERDPGLVVTTQFTWSEPRVISVRQSVAALQRPEALTVTRGRLNPMLNVEPWVRDCGDGCGSNGDCRCYCNGSRSCPVFPFAAPLSLDGKQAEVMVWVVRLKPVN